MRALAARLRQVPLGVLMIAALLGVIGGGSILAGVYFTLTADFAAVRAGAVGLATGAAILYLAYGLVTLARWSWIALLTLTGLFIVSSFARLAFSPDTAMAAAGEIAAEIAVGYYLTRPRIRARFGSSP